MKVFLTALLALALLSCQPAFANTCTTEQKQTLQQISEKQWRVLYAAHDKGEPHDLGYTMMAIAWEESSAGKYRVNLNSHDFGVMQNSLKTAEARTKTKGYYAKMQLVERLIKDDDLSMDLALEELLYWKKHTKTWRHTVSGYNNGWAFAAGEVYLNRIIKNVKMFMNCATTDLEEKMFKTDKDHKVITDDDVGNYVQSLVEQGNEMVGNSASTTNGPEDEDGLPAVWRGNKHQRSDSKSQS